MSNEEEDDAMKSGEDDKKDGTPNKSLAKASVADSQV